MLNEILSLHDTNLPSRKKQFIGALHQELQKRGFAIRTSHSASEALTLLEENPRIMAFIFDWDGVSFRRAAQWVDNLPLFALTDQQSVLDIDLGELELNLDFLDYNDDSSTIGTERISLAIEKYRNALLPPFTKALMNYVKENKYTFCTPGHVGGSALQNSPTGALFYDFFGPNIFKADISISIPELGSLLDHSGPHREAEEFAARLFHADRTLFSTNGTSTANKIVGMYASTDKDTILVDRNCHKSIAHFMMLNNVTPIYLKPTRNAYGIIGGIPYQEFTKEAIKAKIALSTLPAHWPRYAVITNSTYDGLLYNVSHIAESLEIKKLHFDSAWIPYACFNPIYAGKFGMSLTPKPEQTIFETQSTHKSLAAFSQASMIHIKGSYDEESLNESFMIHTSTSPFYPIVASCEISAAMMQGKRGRHLIKKTLERAFQFRQEMQRLKQESNTWYYDLWQPPELNTLECWELKPGESWHGFKEEDMGHMYLDPLKVTVLMPGLQDGTFTDFGIPAILSAMYLNHHGIVVEKTGPYSMLFLFSIGISDSKALRLLTVLNHFKQDFDENLFVKDMLPKLYDLAPKFYQNMRIQELAARIHGLMRQHKLPAIMNKAFDVLPEIVLRPHRAYQYFVRGNTKTIRLRDMMDEVSAVMILPYPPGIPLIMPGEKITPYSKAVLDYLILLEDIGRELPGFAADIHGTSSDAEGYLTVKVINKI